MSGVNDDLPLDESSRLQRLERELVRCIGGDFDFRLTASERDDDLDAIAIGVNVLLDEVQYAMAEAAARREAEAALQKQALLFETIQDGVCVIGLDGYVAAWNPAACRLFGLAVSEVVGGRPFPMLDTASSAALDIEVQRSLLAERSWHGEIAVERSEGVMSVCETTIVPVNGAGAEIVGRVQIFRDVTDRRLLEQRLQHAERLKSLGLLAGGVAHDFNNQLTGIQSAGEVLKRMLGDGNQHLSPYVDSILLASHRAATLTEQLLAFARRGPLRLEPVDLNAVVHEVVELFKRSVDKRIQVHVNTVKQEVAVMGDSTQLQNVLLNIAFNARDAMPTGGEFHLSTELVPNDTGRATPSGAEETYVRISIRDTGTGMPDGVKRRIFEPFFTTKVQGRGIGMGLSAVFGVIEGHGGAIEVRSSVGEGTTFDIDLPLTERLTVLTADDAVSLSITGAGKGEHVLVIDDEELILALVKDILEMEGYRVTAHADSRAGLAYFQEHVSDVDAVILDMMMPHMHGREVLSGMQESDPHVPVVVCSGFSEESDGDAVTASSPTVCFVRKPYELRELIVALTDVMSRGRSIRDSNTV